MTKENNNTSSGTLMLFNGPGQPFQQKDFDIRPLQTGEVLVKNLYTTICASDLHTFCGNRKEACPTVLGHEIVGEIVSIDNEHSGVDLNQQELFVGDIITWTVFSSDPESENSKNNIPQKGDHLFKYGHQLAKEPDVFHGGLSQYCILKNNTAILKLPQTLPLSIAATINCSVSTAAGALRLAGNIRGKSVLVTGMGLLGIICAAMCRKAGADLIIAADVNDGRLKDALDFGADKNIKLKNDENINEQIKFFNKGKGIDVVFDMSGAPDAMELGLESLGIGGTAIWVGAVFNTRNIQVNPEKIIRNLISIKGLHNYNYDDFKYAFDFMVNNWNEFPFSKVVEKEFPLTETQQAFEYAVENKPYRVGINLQL